MKILFSPEYSGHIFTQSGVMMDTVVANTSGSDRPAGTLLEASLGNNSRIGAYGTLLGRYKYMSAYHGNVMAKSFKVAGLSTAKAILECRDELCSADWNLNGASISDRLSGGLELRSTSARIAESIGRGDFIPSPNRGCSKN